MKTALLFPGQGVQNCGIGKEQYEHYEVTKKIYDQAESILDWDVKEICFYDKENCIDQTRYTQGALFTTNYGIYKALESEGIEADTVLGFSLGEYDALVASGILSFEDALKLVDKRARYMEECAQSQLGGMQAVIGLDADTVYELCESIKQETGLEVTIANDNCNGQITVAGTKEALDRSEKYFIDAGARRVVMLKVSGAFHSPLMLEASEKLAGHLEDISFQKPRISIVSNVSASFMDEKEAKVNIPLQIVQGVRFRESIEYLLPQEVDTFIEVGPKNVLSNLVKRIAKDHPNTPIRIFQVEDCESMKKVIQEIGGYDVKRKSCPDNREC